MSNIPTPAEAEFPLLERQVVGLRRRSAVRFRCALGTLGWLSLSDSRDRCEVWVANLSKAGIGLIAGQALAPGTPVVIRLRGPNPGTAVALSACVSHAAPEANDTWRISCTFADRLTDEAFDRLLCLHE
jgi:hypothetical protein